MKIIFECQNCNKVCHDGVLDNDIFYCNDCFKEIDDDRRDRTCEKCHYIESSFSELQYGNKKYNFVCYNCKHYGHNGNYMFSDGED